MVEIKIDTTKASKQDIRRAIEFLKNYVDESSSFSNNSGNDLDISPSAMNIFSQDPVVLPKNEEPEEKSDSDSTDLEIKPIFY